MKKKTTKKKTTKKVSKKTTQKRVPSTKTYELWFGGVCSGLLHETASEAVAHAKKTAITNHVETFLLYGGEVKHGFNINGSKFKLDVAKLKFKKSVEKKKRGGAPKKSKEGTTAVSISMTMEDKRDFEMYADKFAKGNKAEMFRRMFKAWEKTVVQIFGEQVA